MPAPTPMLPIAATPSRSRSAPVVGRGLLPGAVEVVTVVLVLGPVLGGVPGPVGGVGGVQLPWQGGGVQQLPWHGGGMWQLCSHGGGMWQSSWHGGGVWQFQSWHGGGVWQSLSHGGGVWQSLSHGVQASPIQEVEPPPQVELEKPSSASETLQTFSGVLTGAFSVLPEPTGTLKLPRTLPLWLLPPTPDTFEDAPPWHCELA